MNKEAKQHPDKSALKRGRRQIETEDMAEPDDLLSQAARGVREREARRDAEYDKALGEGRH